LGSATSNTSLTGTSDDVKTRDKSENGDAALDYKALWEAAK